MPIEGPSKLCQCIVVASVALAIYAIHEIYELEVNQEDYAINNRLRVDANPAELFRFLMQEHVLEKLLPWLTRFKEADARILSVGKFYRAFLKLPLLGIGRIHLMVVEYRPRKLLVLESGDSITKHRIKIRTKRHHDRTILHTTVYLRKTSALYHYTVGMALRYYIGRHLEKSSSAVAEVYKAVEERLKVSEIY